MTGDIQREDHVARQQAVRLRRSAMGLGAYACTLTLVLACYLAGQLPGWVLTAYTLTILFINAVFFLLIRGGWNLRLRRPDMTLEQTLASVVPGLLVIYFVQDALARAGFLLLALVPMAFGILGLNTRRSLLTGLSIYASYVALLGLLAVFEPQRVNPVGDGILLVAFLAAILQISLLGGYINGLRQKLRGKNEALNEALTTIEDLVNHDELTGTYNRRYLLDVIERETQRCSRGAATFTVGIFDVDHFKRVNDTHGHLMGDRVLAAVAAAIDGSVRRIDCFGRYGGEEFLLIMPQTDLHGAGIKADRLRRAVAGLRFEGEGDAGPVAVTISGGIAEYQPGEAFTRTLSRADDALYRAKDEGRNRVVAAGADRNPGAVDDSPRPASANPAGP
ncbi:diguanylate cyclase [Ectothiorhodospiraceae bacterium WFHF3C12]|nr:diguanylate cyclase [Ectothiorhodospiraceae bacterium WFHF3C12]